MAHMHYKGTGKVHSFRGLLANGGQDKIRIQGATGEIAWRITKLELMAIDSDENIETVLKIYREKQTSVTSNIDFTDNSLLAAGIYSAVVDAARPMNVIVVMDNTLFVRNIYVTLQSVDYTASLNYYIELEEVKVSTAGMAQLAVAAARRTID